MLRQSFREITIATRGRGLYEFTDEVAEWVRENNFKSGLVTLHLRHTSASLLIQENADPDVRRDLDAWFSRLVKDGDPLFVHTAEGDDDMPAHIRTALTAVNLNLPLHNYNCKPAARKWSALFSGTCVPGDDKNFISGSFAFTLERSHALIFRLCENLILGR